MYAAISRSTCVWARPFSLTRSRTPLVRPYASSKVFR